MADVLQIQITAQDGASRVLKGVGDAAQSAGKAIENAGRQGDQGFQKVEQGAKEAERAVDRVGDSAERAKLSFSDFGMAMTAIGAGMVYAGNAALEQERVIISLRRAYGDAADEMIAFADELSSVTIFNDDDILAGERFFATLRNNYNLTVQEIQGLMQITADLASSAGVSFEDASNRVTAAIRGEAEAAEYLGLTMNQQAIDRDNLTLTMSNQEAAQFRLNALYEQAAPYMGTSADLLESEVGTRARLTNAIQDNAQAVASFVGPLSMSVAGMALASSGLANMLGMFKNIGPAIRNSATAMSALRLAFNPVTLGLGALTVAGIATWNMFQDGRAKAQTLEDALISLGDVATNLRLGFRDVEASFLDQFITDSSEAVSLGKEWLNDMDTMIGISQQRAQRGGYQWAIDQVYELQEAYEFTKEEAEQFAASQIAIGAAFANSQVDHAALNATLVELDRQYELRNITLDEYNAALTDIAQNIDRFRVDADAAAASSAHFTTELERLRGMTGSGAAGVDELTSSVNRIEAALEDGSLSAAVLEAYLADLDRQVATGAISWALYQERVADVDEALLGSARAVEASSWAWERATEAAEAHAAAQQEARDAIAETGAAAGAFAVEMDAANEAARELFTTLGAGAGAWATEEMEAWADFVDSATAAMLDLTNNADYLSQVNLTGIATDATNAAEGFKDVATAMDSVLAIFGQIDAMGQRYGQAVSIVDALFGPDGDPSDAVGPLRDLYDAGRIGQEQFNEAVESGIRIQERAAGVEMSLNEIRVDQLPLLEQTSAAYADYIDQIAAMPDAQEQAAMLGWLDSGMQGRVQQFAELGNQLQALGPAGAEAMQQVVDGIVATDPVLTAMLADLGLIKQELDGSYTIDMNAVGAMDSIGMLTESIDALTLAMGGVPPLHVDVTGIEDVEDAERSIQDLIALSAEEAIVRLQTVLEPPTRGPEDIIDWDTTVAIPVEPFIQPIDPDAIIGLAQDMPPVPVPADPVFGDGTAGPVYDGPPVTVPVNFDFAGAAGGGLLGAAGSVLDAAGGITTTVTIDADTSAADEAIAHYHAYDGQTLATAMLMVDGDSSDAAGTVAAMSGYEGVTVATAIVAVDGDPAAALGTITAMSGYDGVNLATAVVSVAGDSSDAAATIQAMGGYDGMVLATTYVDIVARQIGSVSAPRMLGGVVEEYALGGVTIRAGEVGPEIAHFPMGGTALLPRDGLYNVPVGTYISPHNAVGPLSSAPTVPPIVFNNYGTVIGVDDIADSLDAALRQRRAGFGGVRV